MLLGRKGTGRKAGMKGARMALQEDFKRVARPPVQKEAALPRQGSGPFVPALPHL